MSKHLRPKRRLRSQKLRALLGVGVLLGVGATGTFAYWTDDVVISGTTFTAGTIDLQVNNSDAPSTTTLGMSAMVPGNTSAEVLTVKNNGTAPLKYTLTGGLTGTDAAAYNTAAALKLTVVSAGTKSGSGNTSTCTGGTVIYGPTALTNVTSTAIIGTGAARSPQQGRRHSVSRSRLMRVLRQRCRARPLRRPSRPPAPRTSPDATDPGDAPDPRGGARPACLLLGVVSTTADVHVLVFRSGSMSPTIQTGDLALTRTVSASELRVDDVVSVIDSGGNRVTHRVVNLAEQGDQRQLTLRGDANEASDREVYTVTEAQRVVFVLPKAGYLVAWSTGPVGLVLLGGYGAFLLSVLVRGKSGGGDPPPPSRRATAKRRASRRKVPALLAVVLGGGLGTVPTQAFAADWTNPVTVSGTTYTAYIVPKPAIVSCNVTGGLGQKTARITWTEVSSPFALDYTAVIQETGQSMTITDAGATRFTDFSAALLSTVLNATYNIRITAKLPSPNGSWVSVTANQPVTIGLLGLSMSCGTAT